MWIARADAWMTSVIEDMQRRLRGIGRGGREPRVLKSRYNALLPVATANVQAEMVDMLRASLRTQVSSLQLLDEELNIRAADSEEEVLYNDDRRFTVAVYYRPRKVYYIAIQPDVFQAHISSYVGRMMDVYIGYCSTAQRRMTAFSAAEPVVPPSDDDVTSGN